MLLRLERSGGHDRALGTQGWRGASPVQEYSSWLRKEEQDGNESDVEDSEERSAEGKEGEAGVGTAPIDSTSSSTHSFTQFPRRCSLRNYLLTALNALQPMRSSSTSPAGSSAPRLLRELRSS